MIDPQTSPPEKLPLGASGPPQVRRSGNGLLIVALLGGVLLVAMSCGVCALGMAFAWTMHRRESAAQAPQSTAEALPEGWQVYNSPAGRYSVAMPGKVYGENSLVNSFTAEGCAATVTYFDFDIVPGMDRQRLVEQSADQAPQWAAGGGRERERKTVYSLGNAGIEVQFDTEYEGQPCLGRAQVFDVDGRIFRLSWRTPSGQDGSLADHFFVSFRVHRPTSGAVSKRRGR